MVGISAFHESDFKGVIKIVALVDGHVFSSNSGHCEVFMSLGAMLRAHDESRHKSERSKD